MGGSIIDLAEKMYRTTNIPDTLRMIASDFPVYHPVTRPQKARPVTPSFEGLRCSPLKNTVLLDYLSKRGISPDIACRECVEVHYRNHGKWYFAVGFHNRNGGLEIRNAYFKGATSPKDITIVKGRESRSNCLVFEGFMDYLSYLTLKAGTGISDCIVLNSVNNLPKALDVLKEYDRIHCFLDNDDAGRRSVEEIRKHCRQVCDKSVYYLPHKDLNEFLQARILEKKKGMVPIYHQTKKQTIIPKL